MAQLSTGLHAGPVNSPSNVLVKSPKGSTVQLKYLEELTTIAAAATSDTTIQIPVGALVLGVGVYVSTVIPTATTFDVGIAGDTQRFAAGLAVAAGTSDIGSPDAFDVYASATAIRFTPQGGTPGAATGRVRTCIWYLLCTAPTE